MSLKTDMPDGMPMQTRLMAVETVNQEQRTVELVFGTETPVRLQRWSWALEQAIPYDEVLTVSAQAVDLTRLNAGGPVLDSHRTWGLDAMRAVVDRAWIDGKEARALVRFPMEGTSEESDRLFKLVSQGIVRNVSAGYRYNSIRVEKPKKEGEIERWIVERWTPHEISFVTVPADPNSQVRSGDAALKEPSFPVDFSGLESTNETARIRMRMRGRQFGLTD